MIPACGNPVTAGSGPIAVIVLAAAYSVDVGVEFACRPCRTGIRRSPIFEPTKFRGAVVSSRGRIAVSFFGSAVGVGVTDAIIPQATTLSCESNLGLIWETKHHCNIWERIRRLEALCKANFPGFQQALIAVGLLRRQATNRSAAYETSHQKLSCLATANSRQAGC